MANGIGSRGVWSAIRCAWVAVACGLASGACGGATPSGQAARITTIEAPLGTAADTSDATRAAYYAGEVTRYRDIATKERAASTAYAKWTPSATDVVTKNWNATLKASADARATSADQIATSLQAIADFHTAAAAAKAVGQ